MRLKTSPDIIRCSLGLGCVFIHMQNRLLRTTVSLIANPHFIPTGRATVPLSGCLFHVAAGEHICPRSLHLLCLSLPSPSPLFTHTPGLQVFPPPTPPCPILAPWPVCQLQAQQLASSGRRANIYNWEAHPGPHRHTKAWCEPASPQNRGHSLVFQQVPGLRQRGA